MTTLREAAEQALNFMDNCDLADAFNPPTAKWGLDCREALRDALAEQARPVAREPFITNEMVIVAREVVAKNNELVPRTHTMAEAIHAAMLAAPAAPQPPAWPCHCDEQGIGEPGVTCGDCPRDYGHKVAPAAPQPLTDEQILRIIGENFGRGIDDLEYARLIERAHGIGSKT